MGLAMAGSLVATSGISNVTICEKDEARWPAFEKLKVSLCSGLSAELLEGQEIVIIAVKPQDIKVLLVELKGFLKDQLVVSIAAGITLGQLAASLGSSKLVRAMPNTPALVKEAITGWVSLKGLSDNDKNSVRMVLKSFGEEIEFQNEEVLDAVTALSGSGPGYMFYILRNMVEAGMSLGLSQNDAKKMAIQTMKGSSMLAADSIDDLFTLQQKVTSKGGTTEAAISFFEKEGFGEILKDGIVKAFERARELGKK